MVANLIMESFAQEAPYQPLHYFRNMDNTFVIWQHGDEKLNEFLEHLNTLNTNIKLTMEIEPTTTFLKVVIIGKSWVLGNKIY